MNRFLTEYRRTTQVLRRAVGLAPARNVYEAIDDRDLAVQPLGTLPSRQRAALVLTEGLGFSDEESGPILGVKASTEVRQSDRNRPDWPLPWAELPATLLGSMVTERREGTMSRRPGIDTLVFTTRSAGAHP